MSRPPREEPVEEYLQRPTERAPVEGDPEYGEAATDWLHAYLDCPPGYERVEEHGVIESVRPVYHPDGTPAGVERQLLPTVSGTIRPIPGYQHETEHDTDDQEDR